MRQRTIRRPISCSGIGLHSGKETTLHLSPAPPDTGILFASSDGRARFSATADRVQSTRLCTTLGTSTFTVRTVEHLLAAISGLEIDNILITLEGEEIPIMDGSARRFVDRLREAGGVYQPSPRRWLRILRPLVLEEEGRSIRVLPADSPSIHYTIEFDHPALSLQSYHYVPSVETFERELASARTFGFLDDVEHLRSVGLIQGGSLENAVVIGDAGILNPEGLRFPDECVRHKVLDLIGDFSLLGLPIVGAIEAHCSGHGLHIAMLRELLSRPNAWTIEQAMRKDPVRQPALTSAQPI